MTSFQAFCTVIGFLFCTASFAAPAFNEKALLFTTGAMWIYLAIQLGEIT